MRAWTTWGSIAAALTLICCTAGVASATANPVAVAYLVHYVHNGNEYADERLIQGSMYRVGNTGWCSHLTDAGNRFEHAHITSSLPLTSAKYGWAITADNVDEYWDRRFTTYTRVAGCDLTYECYGYSLGYSRLWVTMDGAAVILEDEYLAEESVATKVDWRPSFGHMIKVLYAYEDNQGRIRINTKSEKKYESGIYDKSGCTELVQYGYKPKP